MERRTFVKQGLTLIAVPMVASCKLARASSSAWIKANLAPTASQNILHNLRYEGLPLTLSTLTHTDTFSDDAALLKTHVEEVLNTGAFPTFRVRSSSHSYIGASAAADAYVLNMNPFNRIEINRQVGVARIGAGCRFYQMAAALAAVGNNLSMATGDCPTVGVTGYHTGGGQSLLSSMLGLGVDRVTAATIVIFKKVNGRFKGEVKTISPTQGPELLWACMGGGCDFGLITDLSIRFTELNEWSTYSLDGRHDQPQALRQFLHAWMQLCDGQLDPATGSKFYASRYGDMSAVGVASNASGDLVELRKLAAALNLRYGDKPMSLEQNAQTLAGRSALAGWLRICARLGPRGRRSTIGSTR